MIKIYYLDVSPFEDEKQFDEYYSKCSLYRKNKISSLVPENEKRLSLGASVLLDFGLEKYGLSEKNMIYGKNVYGKPYFENAPEIHFSISHSGTLSAVAFSDQDIGIDIEKIKDHPCEVAKRFYSEKECEFINLQETAEKKNEAFFRLWTLKESFVKAVGSGFSISPSILGFDLSKSDILLENELYTEYHFGEIKIKTGYAFAYCSLENKPDISFESVEEL